MKKFIAASVFALATTMLSAANAGDSHVAADIPEEDFIRVDGTRLSYNIDSDTCKVTLKTRRNIRRITQRDASGEIVKRWSTRKGERVRLFSDFDKFPIALTEGTIKVKTGYRDKVKFQEIGDEFRADLIDCLTVEPEPELVSACPFSSEIADFTGTNVVVDQNSSCSINDLANDSVDIGRPLGFLLLPTEFDFEIEGSVNGFEIDAGLSEEQAIACAVEAGCSELNGGIIPSSSVIPGGSFLP